MKRIISFVLVLCALFTTTACSNESINGDNDNLPTIEFKVENIYFNWDKNSSNKDAINVRKNLSETISVPEYSGDSTSAVVYELNNDGIQIKVDFSLPNIENKEFEIQGIAGKDNKIISSTDKQLVKFVDGKAEGVVFTLSEPITDKLYKSLESISFTITKNAKGSTEVKDIPIYTIFAGPTKDNSPWKQSADSTQTPWIDALDVLYKDNKAKLNGLSTKEDTLATITSYFFNDHGAYYDIHEEALNHYVEIWDKAFNLEKYLFNISEDKKVSCYTQAGVVYIMADLLGIKTDITYVESWGYINKTNLVGVGECNNPFYLPVTCDNLNRPAQPVADPDNSDRSVFGNHAFIQYNNKVYDATLGPALGTQSYDEYLEAMIDISTPAEAKETEYPNKPKRKENWNDYFIKLK